MTTKEYAALKERVEDARERKARAQGAVERIEEQLRKDHGCETIEEAYAKLEELTKQAEADDARLQTLFTKLEKLVDWDDE